MDQWVKDAMTKENAVVNQMWLGTSVLSANLVTLIILDVKVKKIIQVLVQ